METIICVHDKQTLSEFMDQNFKYREGKRYLTIAENVRRIAENDFHTVCQVRGDGNCFIYACIAYLFSTRNLEMFITILMPYCNEIDLALLLNDPSSFIKDATTMQHIAEHLRTLIALNWNNECDIEYCMNVNAIDGYARNIAMNLLGIEEVECYSLHPEEDEPFMRKTKITPKKDLREDIDGKWKVYLLSIYGYTHYNALFK